MDKLFFFDVLNLLGKVTESSKPIAFSEIARKFLNATDRDGLRFYLRWHQDAAPLEDMLDEYLRQGGLRIDTAASFNQLLSALIVFLDGGNYDNILEADPEELFDRYKNELDEIGSERTGPGISAIIFWTPRSIESDMNVEDLVKMQSRNVGNYGPDLKNGLPMKPEGWDMLRGGYGSGSPDVGPWPNGPLKL